MARPPTRNSIRMWYACLDSTLASCMKDFVSPCILSSLRSCLGLGIDFFVAPDSGTLACGFPTARCRQSSAWGRTPYVHAKLDEPNACFC